MNFTLMKDYMDHLTSWRIPGNMISVCVGGKEVFSYASGYENYEKKLPMADATDKLFNVFSCSKPITVAAALSLFERGYFLLDDPLYDFIPEYRQMYIKDGVRVKKAKNPITLRHLFTMTSGLSYNTTTPSFDKARLVTEGRMNTVAVAKCLAEDPLSFEPGSVWQYGLSHDVLAAVVEIVSGKRFSEYVKENIFLPLGMENSFYHNEDVLDRVAELYRYENSSEADLVKLQSASANQNDGRIINNGKKVDLVFGSEYDSGGAGVTCTVSDYSKFAAALACGGVGANGNRILSSSTVELMKTNQLSSVQQSGMTWSQLKGYSYGLGVRTLVDKAQAGSTGNVGEFGWGGAAGATVLVDTSLSLSLFYTHHMLNPQEEYYQPRLRNVLYACISS